MRLPFVALSLCLPLSLLAGCPGGGTGEEGAADSTTSQDPTAADSTSTAAAETDTTAAPATETQSTSPADTETDTAPPDTETDTAPPDTETAGTIAGCECILDEEPKDLNSSPAAPTCGEPLCNGIFGTCVDDFCDLGAPFELSEPADLQCALTALRDRTPGIVTWSFSEGGGIVNEDGYWLINEDGTAVRRDWVREDLTFTVNDAVVGELPPPEIYDACLAEPDDYARFNCLRASLETETGVCDEGWTCGDCI